MNITDKQAYFIENIAQELKKQGVRAKSDLRNEKIGFKIREHTIENVPIPLVAGDREVESQSVTVRTQRALVWVSSLLPILCNSYELKRCNTAALRVVLKRRI